MSDYAEQTTPEGETLDDLLADMALTAAPEIDDLDLILDDEPEEETRCTLCGWVIEDLDLSTMTRQGPVHFDRQCPKGAEKPAKKPAAKKTPERKLAESAGVVKPSQGRANGSHAECEHDATKSARAKCRRERAGK